MHVHTIVGSALLGGALLAVPVAVVVAHQTGASDGSPATTSSSNIIGIAPPTTVKTWADDVTAEAKEFERRATVVGEDVVTLTAQITSLREQLADLDKGKVSSTTISTFIGMDNSVIVFDGVTASPCPPFVLSSQGAYYCGINNIVYIGSWVSTLPFGAQVFVYLHEDGHSEPHAATSSTFEEEQYADEYGGRGMRRLLDEGKITQADVEAARNLLRTIGDEDHGTGTQRVAAFDRGFYRR